MTELVPIQLMHRLWVKQGLAPFKQVALLIKVHLAPVVFQALESAASVEALRDVLLTFERCIRKATMSNVWWNTLGHTRLMRATSDDREWRQKVDARKKKEERVSPSLN